jgi:hypothetical protein
VTEKELLKDIEEKAKSVLKQAIEELWGEGIEKFRGHQGNQTGATRNDGIEDTNTEDRLENLRRKRYKATLNANTEQDPVSTCIDDFFGQKFQVHQVMSGQQNRVPNNNDW